MCVMMLTLWPSSQSEFLQQPSVRCRLRFAEGNSDISADWKSSLSILLLLLWPPSGEIERQLHALLVENCQLGASGINYNR